MELMGVFSWGGQILRGVVDWVYTQGGSQGLLFFLAGVVTYHLYNSIAQKFWKFLIIALVLAAVFILLIGKNPDTITTLTNNISIGNISKNITQTW